MQDGGAKPSDNCYLIPPGSLIRLALFLEAPLLSKEDGAIFLGAIVVDPDCSFDPNVRFTSNAAFQKDKQLSPTPNAIAVPERKARFYLPWFVANPPLLLPACRLA